MKMRVSQVKSPNIPPCFSNTPITVYGNPATRIVFPMGSSWVKRFSATVAPMAATGLPPLDSSTVKNRPSARVEPAVARYSQVVPLTSAPSILLLP